jgi:hypothetical protein
VSGNSPMEFEEAIQQLVFETEAQDGILVRLRNNTCPSQAQVSLIMQALRCVFDTLGADSLVDRRLASALYALAFYSHEYANNLTGVDEETNSFREAVRFDIQMAVESIFCGTWIEAND